MEDYVPYNKKETEDFLQAKKEIIQNYDKHKEDAEGELKKQVERETRDLKVQTRSGAIQVYAQEQTQKRSRSGNRSQCTITGECRKTREDWKQKLAEVSKSAKNTAIDLTGFLPTAPLVQRLLKKSATTDVAMADQLPKSENEGYEYHWNPFENRGKDGWIEVSPEQQQKNRATKDTCS